MDENKASESMYRLYIKFLFNRTMGFWWMIHPTWDSEISCPEQKAAVLLRCQQLPLIPFWGSFACGQMGREISINSPWSHQSEPLQTDPSYPWFSTPRFSMWPTMFLLSNAACSFLVWQCSPFLPCVICYRMRSP